MFTIKTFLFELLCIFCVIGIPFSIKYGFFGWTIQSLIGYLSSFVDWYLFPNTKININLLKINGFKENNIWLIMLFNLICTNALVGIIYYYTDISNFTKWTPFKIFINLIFTEILFTLSHMYLHCNKNGAKLHLMHHCCKNASWSTNLIFHPFDLLAEFSGPVIILLFLHNFIWKDNTTLYISTLILHLWYALDHSANLKLPHVKHHTYINSLFSIYINKIFYKSNPDYVKQLIKYKK